LTNSLLAMLKYGSFSNMTVRDFGRSAQSHYQTSKYHESRDVFGSRRKRLNMLRSFLFVPGDSERKLARASAVEADALILDLEDAVAPSRKELARDAVADYLRDRQADAQQSLWVRINALNTDQSLQDLTAVIPARPDGIVLPKASSPQQVIQLAQQLDELEKNAGHPVGRIGIIPVATETAEAVFQLDAYVRDMPRLRGLTWGAEDLSVVIGASGSRDEAGNLLPVFQQVQSMVLLAAAVAGVQAIETIYAHFDDLDGLKTAIVQSRRQGFTGMLAIHPSQVSVINAAFLPTDEEVERARRVVEAFDNANGAGAIRLDGKMLDQPHLEQARRVLELSRT
jgi:citrate lyase subunit beta/citryl-CoA lyase